MKSKISLSMMCADIFSLEQELKIIEDEKVEYLHIDIMDGEFVPNLMIGSFYINQLRLHTNIPFDFHFMVNNPEKKINWFNIKSGDMVSFHLESTSSPMKIIDDLKEKNIQIGIAIKSKTDYEKLKDYLPFINFILVMTVDPGFSGQKMLDGSLERIQKIKNFAHKSNPKIDIEVDGNVSLKNAPLMKKYGANIFVAGTSSVFLPNSNRSETIQNFRSLL